MNMTESPQRGCLACGNAIGIIRRLARHRFCSNEHEQIYFAQLQELAIERLRGALGVTPSHSPLTTMAVHQEGEGNVADGPFVLAHQVTGS